MPSTQALARQLADEGAAEGTVVVAAEQTAGRGRLGNAFFSPPGGLYCSIVLRPRLRPSQASTVGLAAGVALAAAVQSVSGLTPVLKWPNDLLLNGRKLSGLLLDLVATGETIRYLILGIGVNADTSELPADLRATSLRVELGRPVSRDGLLLELLHNLELAYRRLLLEGVDSTLKAWRAWPNLLGGTVRIAGPGEPWQGTAEDLDADGSMLVRMPSGELRRVVAGEVHLLPREDLRHDGPAGVSPAQDERQRPGGQP